MGEKMFVYDFTFVNVVQIAVVVVKVNILVVVDYADVSVGLFIVADKIVVNSYVGLYCSGYIRFLFMKWSSLFFWNSHSLGAMELVMS